MIFRYQTIVAAGPGSEIVTGTGHEGWLGKGVGSTVSYFILVLSITAIFVLFIVYRPMYLYLRVIFLSHKKFYN